MESVRYKYAPFIHRRAVEFGRLAIAGDDVVRGPQIVDDEGQVWIVVYELGRRRRLM
jgi:hypothetical protein